LYAAAWLAFVPVVGFFWGSIAVSWGLLSSRRGARRAVIIGAIGALLNIVVMFVMLSTAFSGGAYQEAYRLGIRRSMGDVVVALEEYHEETHGYPQSLKELNLARGPLRIVPITDMGAGILHVNLSRQYHYALAPDGSSYDLFSVGPDGKPGTEDDFRPLIPDSLATKTGFRAP
jgi:hypothetical protein